MKKPLTLIILAFFSLSALANAGIPPASPPEPGDTSEVAKAKSLHPRWRGHSSVPVAIVQRDEIMKKY